MRMATRINWWKSQFHVISNISCSKFWFLDINNYWLNNDWEKYESHPHLGWADHRHDYTLIPESGTIVIVVVVVNGGVGLIVVGHHRDHVASVQLSEPEWITLNIKGKGCFSCNRVFLHCLMFTHTAVREVLFTLFTHMEVSRNKKLQ